MTVEWNLVILTYRGEESEALDKLKGKGRFKRSGFRDVLLGNVKDIPKFLEEVEDMTFKPISRVYPIQAGFAFEIEDFWSRLRETTRDLLDSLDAERTFAVRCTRRGHEDHLSSRDIEIDLGELVQDNVGEDPSTPPVDLEDPDQLLQVEIVGNWCGVSVIDRTLREEHYEVRM